MPKLVVSALIIFSCLWSNAQGIVKGKVLGGNEELPFVYVTVKGENLATSTNFNGQFELKNVPIGEQVIEAQFLGYKKYTRTISVKENFAVELKIILEPDILGLEEVTVTANRAEENKKSSTVVINTLNKKQLENLSATTFSDGIKYSPGIRTETNCQNCGFSQVRINGLPGTYSQVLIDGRPTFSALNSIYGLEQIPVEMIERIEVVKGGNSAMYGSSAIGGTINLITAEPTRNSVGVRAESGLIQGQSFDNQLGFQASAVHAQFERGITVFGNYRDREEYDHNDDSYSELPRLYNRGVGFRAFQKTGSFGKLNAEFHFLSEYRRGGNKIDLEPHEADIAEELKSNVFGGGMSYDLFSKNNSSKLNVYSSFQSSQMDNYYGAQQDENGYGQTEDFSWVSGLQFKNEHQGFWNSKNSVLVGAEYKHNDMLDEKPGYNLYVNQNLKTAGLFAQYESFLLQRRLKLSVGGRYDWFNLGNASNLSPRANAMFIINEGVRMRAGYARGFRIPQVFSEDVHVELVGAEIQAIRLAPNLNPEISDSYTASVDWDKNFKKGIFEVILEGFYTQIKNPFVLEEVDNGNTFTELERRNGSPAIVKGINLEFKITDEHFFAFQSSFTLLNSEYAEPIEWSTEAAENQFTKKFLRTPDYYGNASLDIYPMKNATLVFTGLYTGPMWVQHYAGYVPEDRLERTPHFFDAGVKCAYDFKLNKRNGLNIYLGVKNIFNAYQADFDEGVNRDASYVYGPQQPRTFYLGLRYRLN